MAIMDGASRGSLAAARDRCEALVANLSGADAQTLSDQLSAVAGLLDGEWRLRRSLTDVAMSGDARAALLHRLLGGKVADTAQDLLAGVVRSAWSQPGDLVDALIELAVEAGLASADKDGALDDVEDEVFRFGRVVAREPRLSLALSDPALPTDRKTALLGRLLENRARTHTLALVRQAVIDTGGRSLDRRLERITVLAAERRQRVVAQVRVARPLDANQVDRLRAALAKAYGRGIQLQIDLDPEVLGGVVVTVGGEILDGSVARRIEQVRDRLHG